MRNFYKGTFGATDRLSNETECTACTGGHYCDSQALTQPAGGCSAGYYCVSGIHVPQNKNTKKHSN